MRPIQLPKEKNLWEKYQSQIIGFAVILALAGLFLLLR